MARWLKERSHRIVPWECDLSSQTGASQAGLLLGSNHDMPAFRWYEKEIRPARWSPTTARTRPSSSGAHSDGGGLLAVDGASRGNLFSGDAPHCSATMSVIRDRERSRASEYFAYFADPYGLTRTIALYLWDVLHERRAARRQRKLGEEHIDRRGLYPWMRGAITVIMRDLNVATLMGDIVEGVPVVYSTFVGYDEVAHHSGDRATRRLRGAQTARRPARASGAGGGASSAAVSARGSLRSRPEPGSAIPAAIRADA